MSEVLRDRFCDLIARLPEGCSIIYTEEDLPRRAFLNRETRDFIEEFVEQD